jgi:ParB-like chromosome segregation protein Spo0J
MTTTPARILYEWIRPDQIADSILTRCRRKTVEADERLRESIATVGVIHPLVVAQTHDQSPQAAPYRLVVGSRRLRACQDLVRAGRCVPGATLGTGFDGTIPAYVYTCGVFPEQVLGMLENTHREPLSAWDLAQLVRALIEQLATQKVKNVTVTVASLLHWSVGRVSTYRTIAARIDEQVIRQAGGVTTRGTVDEALLTEASTSALLAVASEPTFEERWRVLQDVFSALRQGLDDGSKPSANDCGTPTSEADDSLWMVAYRLVHVLSAASRYHALKWLGLLSAP